SQVRPTMATASSGMPAGRRPTSCAEVRSAVSALLACWVAITFRPPEALGVLPARSAAAWASTALDWACQTWVSAGSALPRAAPRELSADTAVASTQASRTTVSTPATASGGDDQDQQHRAGPPRPQALVQGLPVGGGDAADAGQQAALRIAHGAGRVSQVGVA